VREADLTTWTGLLAVEDPGFLAGTGREVVAWAVDVHRDFFSDAWLERAARRRSIAYMAGGLWPINAVGPAVRLVERACQLELLRPAWPVLQGQVAEGIPTEAARHLRLIVETAGLLLRAGHLVEVEPRLGSGRKPDLRARIGEEEVLLEVTAQSKDKAMRRVESYARSMRFRAWEVERRHSVVVTFESETALDDAELDEWFRAIVDRARVVEEQGESEPVIYGRNTATVHPAGTPITTIHDGPTLGGDAWPRLDARLRHKAAQTAGGSPAWIRVDVEPTLFALTNLSGMTPDEKLASLATNVAASLSAWSHVTGAVVTLPPSPTHSDASVQRRLLDDPAYARASALTLPSSFRRWSAEGSGPAVLSVPLPGSWSRESFVLANPTSAFTDRLRPGDLLAAESSWLEWALADRGLPKLETLFVSEVRSPAPPAESC
jgi:hypothetical protein